MRVSSCMTSTPKSGRFEQLETQLCAQLHLPRALRAEDAPEVGGAEDAAWDVEVHLVERVEDFPPQFELARAAHTPRLRNDEIEVREPRTDRAVSRRAAKRVERRHGKR